MALTIKMTPEDLRGAATSLGTILSDMQTDAGKLKSEIDTVTDNWEGAAQSEFHKIFHSDLWPVFEKTLPDVINGMIGQLNGAAAALEAADAEIASKLRGQ